MSGLRFESMADMPPKKREPQRTKRQAERLLKAEILSRFTPLYVFKPEMQSRIISG